MYTLRLAVIAALLTCSLASAQTRLPARQVSVDPDTFTNIAPSPETAQGSLQWIDDNWDPLDSTGWVTLAPTADTTQASFDWVDDWLSLGPYLQGTNIVGAAFTNGQWTIAPNEIPLSTNGWGWLTPTNATVQATFDWLDGEGPFLQDTNPWGDDVTALRSEIYAVLRELGLSSYDAYTAVPGTYTENWQVYTVPTDAVHESVIEVRLWGSGGGGSAAAGGYARGDLVVLTNGFSSANASHTYPGMEYYVQIGGSSQRAAIWRVPGQLDVSHFNSMTEEILVAGGAGGGWGGGSGGVGGGETGGTGSGSTSGFGAGGGTQSAGGAAGSFGVAGARIWGATTYSGGQSWYANRRGGDGYYGGGSARAGEGVGGDGGGGSGFAHSDLSNAITTLGNSSGQPAGVDDESYGFSNAGVAGQYGSGNPGRAAFKRALVP